MRSCIFAHVRTLLFLAPALCLAACTPTQNLKPRVYAGDSAEILALIGQAAVKVQPKPGYNFFSVLKTNSTQVILQAEPLISIQTLWGWQTITTTFTVLQSGGKTSVTSITKEGDTAVSESSEISMKVDNIYKQIAAKYQQVQ